MRVVRRRSRKATLQAETAQSRARVKLQFFTDPKTGAKITGISGRKMGLDKEIYENLDKEGLELEDGFKILLLHKGISAAYHR